MVEIIIGLFILLHLFLGLREGLAKTAASILMVFLSLYLASAAVNSLAGTSPELANPHSQSGIIVFGAFWIAIIIVSEILLMVLLRRAITITVLGPIDKAAGLVLGLCRGLLVAGVILQLYLAFPVAEANKQEVQSATTAKFSLTAYQWSYPYVKQWSPYLGEVGKENLLDKLKPSSAVSVEARDLEQLRPEKLMDNVDRYKAAVKEQDKRLKELLEDKDAPPPPPVGRPR
jgi:uncharacterized membrane protein required for colicin V production